MSLFKLKTVWAKSFPNKQFDEKHLAVGKIGRQPAIALANFQGNLQVFMIFKNKEIEVTSIYQNLFQSGIIEVKFVFHPDERIRNSTLGVLFFRKFAYINFETTNIQNNYSARILYVDVEPSFGIGITPISVMTLNSTIQYLNPLQIQKIKIADPIYPFARSLNKLYFVDGQQLVEIQGSTEQWRIIVGRIRQLFVFVDTIVAIGERALWQITQAKIVKTKIMDEDISTGTIAFRNINAYNIVVANFSGQLFIYSSNYELLWAMKLDYVPLRIIICQHEEIKGLFAILSEQGTLELAYSGVQVPDTVIEPLSQSIDYSIVQSETEDFMKRLNNKTDEVEKTQQIKTLKTGYKLYFGLLQKSFENIDEKDRLYQIEGKVVKFELVCQITSSQNLRNLKIQINLPFNLYCPDQNTERVVAKSGDKVIFLIYANNQSFPYENDLSVIIRYENNEQSGSAFIKVEKVAIPMDLQCCVNGYESKDSFQNKIIIKSNNQMPAFNDIFPQLVSKDVGQQRKCLKISLSNGVPCIITYNKGFNKAKIESSQYSGLCYIVSQFSNHIRRYNQKNKSKIQLSVQIPLEEFFAIMKQHYEQRILFKKAFADVEVKSEEFRNTQKKLLIKMKEKMNNMGNIDKLLEYTYDRLIESATSFDKISHEMDIINHNLCVAIKLVIELLFIRSNPSQKAKNIAMGILGYQKQSLERGWEDKVFANSSYYLNKKYNKNDHTSFDNLQKIPLFVISKVNNGDWN